MSGTMSRRLNALPLTGLTIAALALLGASSFAHAEKVGVAAAVHPDAFTEGTEVKIGNSIFYNQRINTTGSGLVQVLLVDGSTFTVGPGSDLVIDKFVYDPSKNTGEVVATLSKGVLRFVGGKLSKNEGGVTVNTPTGALAIRGGMFHLSVQGQKILASFLFGNHMTITDGGTNKDVYSTGYTYDNGTVRPTRPEDTAFFMKALSGPGKVVVGGDGDNKEGPAQTAGKTKVDVSEITQDGSTDVVQADAQKAENQAKPQPGPAPQPSNTRVLGNANFYTAFIGTGNEQDLSNPNVLPGKHGILGGDSQSTADDFLATPSLSLDGTRLTVPVDIVSKYSDPPNGTVFTEHIIGAFDLPAEFDAEEGSPCALLGICLVTDAHLDASVNGVPQEPMPLKGSAVARPGFIAYQLFAPFEGNFQIPSLEGSPFDQRVGVIQALRTGISEFTGVDLNAPVLIISGDKYTLPSVGQVHEFQLLTDPRQSLSFQIDVPDDDPITVQNFVAPFATLEGSPLILGNGEDLHVSTLKVLEADSSGGRGVWLQTSLYIGTVGQGCEVQQQSMVVVALGLASNATGLTGERRGGSDFNSFFSPSVPDNNFSIQTHGETNLQVFGTAQERIAYTGGIATLASGNGAHFLGKAAEVGGVAIPNFVIGADSTGAGHNIFLDKPLTDVATDGYASATYHVGVGSNLAPTPPEQTSGTFHGYAAGVVALSPGSLQGNDSPVNGLVSQSSNDVTISFDAARNTLSATLITHVLDNGGGGDPGCTDGCSHDKGGMTLVLGDPAGNSITGRSAFIDNTHYAAIETPNGSSVQTGEIGHPNNDLIGQPTGYLVSGQQLDADNVLLYPSVQVNQQGPPTVTMTHQAFCQDCAFLKWGAWGVRAGFVDAGYTNTDNPGESVPPTNVTADVHLGWWVAGNTASDTELDALRQEAVASPSTDFGATYAGHAIGTVANNLSGQGAITYVATGNMDMSWNFGERSGRLDITHFDAPNTGGLSFGGSMQAPGVLDAPGNAFTGTITGQLPEHLPCVGCLPGSNALSGVANGSFVHGNDLDVAGAVGKLPQGVIGNWNIGNGQGNNTFTYGATGIFAGKAR
jgi:hypothetical protein